MRFGFSDTWWPSLANSLDWLQSLGCDCVRFGVALPLDGNADPIYEELVGRNIRPYMVLGGWNPAPAPEVYGQMVAAYADRYRKNTTFCLWNEPNYRSDQHPNPLPVEDAIALNLAGASAAMQANPDARVLYSPVGPSEGWEHYFQRLYDALPEGDVAIHCYPGGKMEGRLAKVEVQYRLAAPHGRVHVTEIDMAAPWLGDTDAPKLAGKAYELLEDLGAKTVIFHSIANHRREAAELKRVAR